MPPMPADAPSPRGGRRALPPEHADRSGSAAPPHASRSRSLAGYLVMPRPKDAVKGLLMPFVFLLAVVCGAEPTGRTVIRALIVWAALELLLYPARYQWNDIRGFAADQRHPSRRDRGRLPGPLARARAHVTASGAVAVGRLVLTAVLALALPALHLGGVLTAAGVAVFGVAAVYEALRARCTGRVAATAPSARPDAAALSSSVRPDVAALWIVVGAGYAVRGMTGLALAVDVSRRPVLAVAAAGTLWAFGVAFVTSRWALESLAFATSDHGRLTWTARADQAREHLLALVRWLPRGIIGGPPGDWTPLRLRTPPTAPWNVALLAGGTSAALTGSLLATARASVAHALLAVVLGALTTWAVVLFAHRRPTAVAAGATAHLLVSVLFAQPRPLAAVLPWLSLMASYLVFSSRCLHTIGAGPRLLRSLVVSGLVLLARTVLGRATWDAVRKDPGDPR
ncbi:hypothetical protein [Streptomyces beigongshangae]|uniref:hypothetical protein n=1 Tax=Streptomyces beigongshangae TaxID=2841597 RepID=UPI001C8542DB|nr:hypothetical protein [Streptomyces sp. REN17]